MTTTVKVFVPIPTIVMQTVVFHTSVVTVFVTTGSEQPLSFATTSTSVDSETDTDTGTQTSSFSTSTPIGQSSSHTLAFSFMPSSTVSAAIQSISMATTSTINLPVVESSVPTSTISAMPTTSAVQNKSHSTKTSIIAGLAGAIAGLLVVGLVIFLALRWRRKNRGKEEGTADEKGTDPIIGRGWSSIGESRDAPSSPAQFSVNARNQRASNVTVDEDHHIIRMSTQHWPRPFAQGGSEGYREFMPAGQLRVMNPDITRPPSSRMSSDTARDFLRRQRTALTDIIFRSPRSRANSRAHGTMPPNQQNHDQPTHPLANEISPHFNVHAISSNERITSPEPVAVSRLPSLSKRSINEALSVSTRSIIGHVPPEDPFLTPPAEENASTSYIFADSLEANSAQVQAKSVQYPAILQTAIGSTSKHLNTALTAINILPSRNNMTDQVNLEGSQRPTALPGARLSDLQSPQAFSISASSHDSFYFPPDTSTLYNHPNTTTLLPSPIAVPFKSLITQTPVLVLPLEPGTATSGSSWRASRLSDPFDLDRPSVRGSRSSLSDIKEARGQSTSEQSARPGPGQVLHQTSPKAPQQSQEESWALYEET